MSKRKRVRRTARQLSTVAVGLATSAGLAVTIAAAASAAPGDVSSVVGHVYVDDNTAGANTIGVFDRHADGTLTPDPDSPVAAGGAGTGKGLASQGAIQLSPDGRWLIAVDAGSDQLSVLQVNRDGSLSPGTVVSSGGATPVSITINGDLVYVANAGPADSNYTGFRFHNGRLIPIPHSTVPLASDAQPGDVLFNNSATKLVGTEIGTSVIDSFTVLPNGRLSEAPGSPFAAQGLGPFGSEFRPTNADQLFVSNAHNVGPLTGTVSAFADSASGVLTSIGSSPFADQQTAPCWVEITNDGAFLFTVNTASGEISSYSIAPDGALTLIGSTPVGDTGGLGAVDARLSPDGRYLYVDESRIGSVGTFAVNGGQLTELTNSPTALPAGATPAGISVN